MKKCLIWICTIACIFGLTACGSERQLTEYEQYKVENAQLYATEGVMPLLAGFMAEDAKGIFDEYTMEEIAYQVQLLQYQLMGQVMFEADGYAFYSAVQSFQSAAESIGAIQSIGGTSAKIDGDQIIVDVDVVGEKKNATAEVIFSNDRFLVMESAALNPVSTMGELMTAAALNTLIGMGTVFAVLILISAIISAFRVVPVIQKKLADRKAAGQASDKGEGIENAVAQIVGQEEADAGDDLELAAVIAAAVAAYEGAAPAEGFVVRSIRKRR